MFKKWVTRLAGVMIGLGGLPVAVLFAKVHIPDWWAAVEFPLRLFHIRSADDGFGSADGDDQRILADLERRGDHGGKNVIELRVRHGSIHIDHAAAPRIDLRRLHLLPHRKDLRTSRRCLPPSLTTFAIRCPRSRRSPGSDC